MILDALNAEAQSSLLFRLLTAAAEERPMDRAQIVFSEFHRILPVTWLELRLLARRMNWQQIPAVRTAVLSRRDAFATAAFKTAEP